MVAAAATREQWLNRGVKRLRPLFIKAGHPLPPKIRVSIGFGISRRHLGEAWSKDASTGKCFETFIRPDVDNPVEILDTMAHEMVHHATPGAKHGPVFVQVCNKVGLTEGKARQRHAGSELLKTLEKIATDLGPFPHSALMLPGTRGRVLSGITKRLRCPDATCNYNVMADVDMVYQHGAPECPVHNQQMVYRRKVRS